MILPQIIQLLKIITLLSLLGAYSQFTLAAEDLGSPELNYDYREFVYWLKKNSDEKKIPGAALAIVSREGIMYLQTWGVSNIADQTRITNESLFRIASMSKTFAGTATALLVEKNLQSWDKKIIDILNVKVKPASGGNRRSMAVDYPGLDARYIGRGALNIAYDV